MGNYQATPYCRWTLFHLYITVLEDDGTTIVFSSVIAEGKRFIVLLFYYGECQKGVAFKCGSLSSSHVLFRKGLDRLRPTGGIEYRSAERIGLCVTSHVVSFTRNVTTDQTSFP